MDSGQEDDRGRSSQGDPIKKDTRRKYEDDHAGEDSPVYRNMAELERTLSLTSAQRREMQNTIQAWFKAHPDNEVQGLKTNHDHIQIQPLLEHLSQTYRIYFEDDQPGSFVLNTCKALIQRTLSNQRRNRSKRERHRPGQEESRDPPSSAETSRPCGDGIPRTRSPEAEKFAKGPEENFGLHAQLEGTPQLSCCTVGDVLDQATERNVGLSLIQRISFTRWHEILGEDLQARTTNFIVRYETRSGWMQIRADRHLKSAVMDAQAQGWPHAHFQVTLVAKTTLGMWRS